MPENRLILTFGDNELIHSQFYCAAKNRHYFMVRGKCPGAYLEASGSFQWTRGVRALAALLVRHHLAKHSRTITCRLEGEKGSLAASLDYASAKTAPLANRYVRC